MDAALRDKLRRLALGMATAMDLGLYLELARGQVLWGRRRRRLRLRYPPGTMGMVPRRRLEADTVTHLGT